MNRNPALISVICYLTLGQIAMGQEPVDYRLPPGVTPVSQTIELKLDPAGDHYSGNTTIHLDVTTAVDRIGIYQVGLDMADIKLSANNKTRALRAATGEWDINWLTDGETIGPGEYELAINFTGNYATDSLGMYHVAFESNEYIFTQMEAMYARRAFPVFDEPSFKIPYQLTITAPIGDTVVANTPVLSATTIGGWQRVEFLKTKPLPSYLLAFAVGPLDHAEIKGLSMSANVYTPKGHADELGFVLRETPKIVAALEDYFGTEYPYRKLDFVAVPDFAFGAMENPGLITYRTDLLLVGDEVSGTIAENVLNVIAHEVAHIWYGDLVTMTWWNDLWLNEAFATWMARSTLERIYPQYNPELKLPQTNAFESDGRTTSKAIRKTVRNEEEILDGIFLNYSKGHALLRMLESYVGKEVWQKGIREYLSRYAWSNASESDLWATITDVSGVDVSQIAGDYLNQPGFATINVDRDGSVSQKRYLAYGRKAKSIQWRIPLNIKYKANGKTNQTFHLLEDKTDSVELPENVDWIFPDAGGNGYFRWQVDRGQFFNLLDDIDQLSNREKIALLDNSEALLNSGDLSLADYMFVLNRLIEDAHPLVFLPTLEKLKDIGDDFIDPSNREMFARFVDNALSERFKKVGVENQPDDSEALIQMRPRLLRVLGQYGSDANVRASAAKLADQYLASNQSVSSDLAREALRVTALYDDGGRYADYKKAYLDSESADQKSNILGSIYFDNPKVIKDHLDFSITPDVAAGDAGNGINLFAFILDDHTPLYTWLDKNFDAFQTKLPSYYHALMPQFVSGGACNKENLKLLTDFFEKRGDLYATSLAKAVETAETCIARKERNAVALETFLLRKTIN